MQLKSLVRYPLDIRRARRLLMAARAPEDAFSQRPIALDLVTPQMLFDCGRHLACLAHYSQAAGSQFLVRCSPLMLASIARKIHGREMLAEPYVRWLAPAQPLPKKALVLRDYDSDQPGVRMLIGRDQIDGAPTMPYPMHPATLSFADPPSLLQLRQSKDRGGIFFAGNQKPKYGEDKMTRDFGLLSRLRILQMLRGRFPDRVVDSMSQRVDRHSIVLSDSRVESIPASHWLSSLARAQFFVCCPGASQPTCHNLIEAMSVGTIPLIEYGSRVTPPLQDGIHAITFQGEQGLVRAIERIDRLSASEIETMSGHAASFYDQHLCGRTFLAGLRDGETDCRFGQLSMPFHDRNLFDFSRYRSPQIAA
jgi:hypothetical protein